MKRIELLSISVVAAAFLMTGCGSSDSTPAGPVAPAEATAALELNSSSVQNLAALLQNSGGGPSAQKAEKMVSSIKAKIAELKSSGTDHGTDTYDCQVSGTYTYTYASSWNDTPDGSWTSTWNGSATYDHCIDNYSYGGTIDGIELNIYYQNGTYSWNNSAEYNSDTNRSKDAYSSTNNYVYSYENNETKTVSRTYTSSDSYSYTMEADGDYVYAGNVSYKHTWQDNGEYKRVDTNSTGDIFDGYRYVYGNISSSEEATMDYTLGQFVNGKTTDNGFYSYYDTDASGEHLVNSHYFNNYVTNWSSDGANEHNMTVSGTIGDTCLGGSVSLTTAPVIQENQVDYFDGSDNTGSNVLPYAGSVGITGSTTATLSFSSDDTNHTSATVIIGDTNDTYTGWSTLAVGACGI